MHYLEDTPRDEYLWRYENGKWCLLEIICHLYDEEREDFRTRLQFAVESSKLLPPLIDPVNWVKSRDYISQDFTVVLNNFLEERKKSVNWLKSIDEISWDHKFQHPALGWVSASFFLTNWLAHDYLHLRQITRIKYWHLKISSDEELKYAGEW